MFVDKTISCLENYALFDEISRTLDFRIFRFSVFRCCLCVEQPRSLTYANSSWWLVAELSLKWQANEANHRKFWIRMAEIKMQIISYQRWALVANLGSLKIKSLGSDEIICFSHSSCSFLGRFRSGWRGFNSVGAFHSGQFIEQVHWMGIKFKISIL